MSSDSESPLPTWALVLAGGLLASWLAPATAVPGEFEPRRPPRLADASARELRGVPGLGETRALGLVEARWEHADGDPPLFLADVVGVGPVSSESVAAWLATHVDPEDPSAP